MGGDWCSLVVLCLGAVASLSAMALVSIGSMTDHWTLTTVDRTSVVKNGLGNESGYMYFTRNRGIFRTCFPLFEERPAEGTPGLFLNLVDDWCYSREYHLDSLRQFQVRPPNITDHAAVHLQLKRSTPALLFTYIVSMSLVGLLGLVGCWQQSANKLITTAAAQLLAALIGASAMATWHAALFFEMEKVRDEGYPLSWPKWLQESTTVTTSWSYIVTWVGVCLTLLASLATSASAICLRSRRSRDWEDNSLRLKLKMSRMFAQHAYFPHDMRNMRSSPSIPDSEFRDYPTMPANFPTHNMIKRGDREIPRATGSVHSPAVINEFNKANTSANSFNDYKKVVTQLEDSKF